MILLIAFTVAIANAQTVTFYFAPQSSELSIEDMDSLVTLLENNVVTKVIGFANALPNTRTSQANLDLAYDRAFNITTIAGQEIKIYSEVTVSDLATDRRVEITFAEVENKEMLFNKDREKVDVKTTSVDSSDKINVPFVGTIDMDDAKNITLNGDSINSVVDFGEIASSNTNPCTSDTVIVFIEVQKPLIFENESSCDCTAANLGWVESEWKNARKRAKEAKPFSKERKEARAEAARHRRCMQYSWAKWKHQQKIARQLNKMNGITITKSGQINKYAVKTSYNAKPKKRNKKRQKIPRGNGLVKMSMAKWVNLTFGLCLGR